VHQAHVRRGAAAQIEEAKQALETASATEGTAKRELQTLRAQLNFLRKRADGIEPTTNLFAVEDEAKLQDPTHLSRNCLSKNVSSSLRAFATKTHSSHSCGNFRGSSTSGRPIATKLHKICEKRSSYLQPTALAPLLVYFVCLIVIRHIYCAAMSESRAH
jgi:hypothetical protein